MSTANQDEPYVYQPLPMSAMPRAYGVSYKGADIKGLTKIEAETVCSSLKVLNMAG